MTPLDVKDRIKILDTRTARIDAILPTLATKDDVKGFATKDDLKSFATKDDLKGFATKDDLKGFATKDDLKSFATKDDLKDFATKDDLKAFATREDLIRFATTEELRNAIAVLATKDELRTGLDEARRYALVLNEATRGDIQLLAEHMATKSDLRDLRGEMRSLHAGLRNEMQAIHASVTTIGQHVAALSSHRRR